MLCVTAPYRYMYILFSVWVRQNHTAPQRDRSDPISTLPHTAQAFLCPTPAFPCTQGDSDPPWLRQLMTMLLATGSSAFSAQTALPVLKFAYKNLRVPDSDSSFLTTCFCLFFVFLSLFLILILSHLPSWVCMRWNIFKFSRIAKFWGSKRSYTYHVCP